jgi:hypothetical protein
MCCFQFEYEQGGKGLEKKIQGWGSNWFAKYEGIHKFLDEMEYKKNIGINST